MTRKSTRAVGLVASLAVAAGALAGCGQSGDPDSLTFMFRGSPDEEAAYTEAIEAFEAESGIEVDMIMTTADEYATKLRAAIVGGQIPDVFYFDPGSVESYANAGVIQEITPYIEASDVVDLDNMWDYGVDSYRYDGEQLGRGPLYALPKDVGPFSFGYNATMLEEAGIELPDPDEPYTWEEWLEILEEVTQDTDGDGKTDQWGTGLNVTWNLQAFAWSNGGEWLNEDATQVTVDTPEFAEALQYFSDLDTEYGVTPSIAEAQTLDTYQRWMQGQIAFFPIAPWDIPVYQDLDFEWDLMPYPVGRTGEPASWIGTLGIGVSAATANPQAAADLVAHLSADPDTQRSLAEAGVQIPNLIDMAHEFAADDSTPPVNKEEFLDVIEDYGRALPPTYTYNPQWYDELYTNIQPVLEGRKTAADYLAEAQPRMQAFLDMANDQSEMSRGTK
ncbi:ABC transporter substrate-binding protein [Zhihengliuella halotolerans]|uniref:ABC transporter substrate-binding protein n=1 Tax=Zhihengliuella halotolerans TaxID=370736 RepID=UPI000C80E174|nr:sugar ABC transporter substrate-binding protein [Zhihengliuella halotolerans]